MPTEHESTWAWAHIVHKQEFSVTKYLWQSHEMGPFSYCQWVQVWFSKLLHIENTKQMNYTFPNTIQLMVVVSNLWSYFYQMRLDQTSQWQCGTLSSPLELFAKSLQDPQVMKDIVCFPQREYTDCGSRVYNKNTSADWFYEAFNNSPATESGMLWHQPGYLFVGIGHFDDFLKYWPFDEEVRASFPPKYVKSDTRALSIIWLLDDGVSTTWSWGEWSWTVFSIKSQVEWW
jgi:hypothetical protein